MAQAEADRDESDRQWRFENERRQEAEQQLAQAREGYWPADKVLEALDDLVAMRIGPSAVSVWRRDLERRFSGEGAS